MSSEDKKVIAIIGATGAQGGSVINAILSDSNSPFTPRAITRDATKHNAQKLKERGCEVVEADLSDKESLEKAFEGAYGVFGVTDFWATMNADIEIQQGKNIVDAAKAAGVEHLVFSSLINVSKVSKGKLTGVTHFDSKAKIAEYTESVGVPASFFMPGFYMSNLQGMIQKHAQDGSLTWMLPIPENSKIPIFDTRGDSGKYVVAILKKGLEDKSVLGKEYPAATRYMTPKEIIDTIASVNDVKGNYIEIPYDAFKKALMDKGMPEIGAEDTCQNMVLMSPEHVGYFGGMEVESVWKEFGLKPTELKEWVTKNWKQ